MSEARVAARVLVDHDRDQRVHAGFLRLGADVFVPERASHASPLPLGSVAREEG